MESPSGAGENPNSDDDVEIVKIVVGESSADALLEFKRKNHSLGINASSVAACVGYHEFQSLPELMLQHVYQGGQELLKHDARLLGLQLVSTQQETEAELLQLAEASGSTKVVESVRKALKVKHGDQEEKLHSVQEASKLKQAIAKHAKAKLTPRQLEILQEGTRQAIDTGCGHAWEEQALDQYERQCGWEVRDRNAECKVWDFEKTTENDSSTSNTVPSLQPLGPARSRQQKKYRVGTAVDKNTSINHQRYDSRGVKRKLPSSYDSQISETALMDFAVSETADSHSKTKNLLTDEKDKNDVEMVTVEGSLVEGAESIPLDHVVCAEEDESDDRHHSPHQSQRRQQNETNRPFVSIKGMVDGIRDELGPTTNCGEAKKDQMDDDLSCDSFSLSRVIVECKHRMHKLLPNGPRFSECIQAVVYCFMYEADDADIVQVLRYENHNTKKELLTDYFEPAAPPSDGRNGAIDTTSDKDSEDTNETTSKETRSITRTKDVEIKDSSKMGKAAVAPSEATENNEKKNDTSTRTTTNNNVTMTIAVDRVSLDDPNFGHRANWKAVILPKLRQWVDAVYTIRQSDDKRYRLLTSLSALSASESQAGGQHEQMEKNRKNHAKAAWELVFDECEFLREGLSGERCRRETT